MELIYKSLRSEIYKVGPHKLLKLYSGWMSAEDIAYEFEATQMAFKAGIMCAKALEIVEKQYRQGIVFEYIEGIRSTRHMFFRPWKIRHIGIQMAQLHADLHLKELSGLKKQTETLNSKIETSHSILTPVWNKVTDYRDHLFDNQNFACHGDFTPDNILYTPQGLILLDWTNATSGNPLADIAKTWILINTPYSSTKISPWIRSFVKKGERLLTQSYLSEYQRIKPFDKEELLAWRIPMAAARISENIPGEKMWLLNIIKNTNVKLP